MNKTAIKNFAIWARNKLRSEIAYKAGLLGISEKGIAEPLPHSTDDLQIFDIGTSQPVKLEGKTAIEQRRSLVAAIKAKRLPFAEAFDAVIEEVAYTWFNRLIAVRFMEVNDYLPSRMRVLSSDNSAKAEPDFVTSPFDTDIEFTDAEKDHIDELKDHSKSDELFQFMFIRQCNKLNEILPELFEKTNDYTELLLNVSFTDKDGIVYHLVHDIPEDDFNIEKEGQVEIIGWLYQYYITELNEMVYDGNLSKEKIKKELLPAATTIYTPDWAIRYMVENSLGRTWTDIKPDTDLKSEWKYYLSEAEQSDDVQTKLLEMRKSKAQTSIEEITFLDPCMGSGHILVYAFDVFMQIYTSQGYTERDAAQKIVENNLYGLELDDRAAQLAYFAVMMKARSYDRRFLGRGIRPNLCSIKESNNINPDYLELFGELKETARKLYDEFIDAEEYGSILNLKITAEEIAQLEEKYNEIITTDYDNLIDYGLKNELCKSFMSFLVQAKIMVSRYDVVCTNPPYLGSSRFSPKLDKYIKDNYSDVKSDLSMVMYKKSMDYYSRKSGYIAFITTSSWMFLSSFEKLRLYLNSKSISSLVDFGTELFEGKVGHNPIVSWVTYNNALDYKMTAIRLVDYCYSRRDEKQPEFFNDRNRYFAKQSNFSKIPGSPVAYWVSDNVYNAFNSSPSLCSLAPTKMGLTTGDNNRFLKFWFEIENEKIGIKYQFYNKGGEYRRWYGNIINVIDWENDGEQVRKYKGSTIRNDEYYFRKCISWGLITSSISSFRSTGNYSCVFGDAGPGCFPTEKQFYYILAFLNSKPTEMFLSMMNPTINLSSGVVANLPLIIKENDIESINNTSYENENIVKTDWDSFETSWDFEKHPLI